MLGPDYSHGWVAFTVSIIWIGILTGIIGDVSSHMGCSVGLKDSCTALTLVAMGTSLPGTDLLCEHLISARPGETGQTESSRT